MVALRDQICDGFAMVLRWFCDCISKTGVFDWAFHTDITMTFGLWLGKIQHLVLPGPPCLRFWGGLNLSHYSDSIVLAILKEIEFNTLAPSVLFNS